MRRTRPGDLARAALAVAVVMGLSGCSGGGPDSAASCAAPMIELQESSLHPGGVVRLSADFVWETCEDTGGTSRAASDVTVSVTPSATGEEIVLARPTPEGERSTVSGSFDLPADLPLGDAVLAVRSHSGDAFEAELPIAITAPPSN